MSAIYETALHKITKEGAQVLSVDTLCFVVNGHREARLRGCMNTIFMSKHSPNVNREVEALYWR